MTKIVIIYLFMLVILGNLHVSGNQNCNQKIFLHNSAMDDMIFEGGLLLEVGVSGRAGCVSLSHLQDDCHLISYNRFSSLCRLHYNLSGTGQATPDWRHYEHLQ